MSSICMYEGCPKSKVTLFSSKMFNQNRARIQWKRLVYMSCFCAQSAYLFETLVPAVDKIAHATAVEVRVQPGSGL
jgi:hypothetical protein